MNVPAGIAFAVGSLVIFAVAIYVVYIRGMREMDNITGIPGPASAAEIGDGGERPRSGCSGDQ